MIITKVTQKLHKYSNVKELAAVLPPLAFYGSIYYLLYGIFTTLGSYRSFQIIGICNPFYISLVVAIGTATLTDRKFCYFLRSRKMVAYFYGLVFYFFVGLFEGNGYLPVKYDLVTLLWPIGGLALFRLMMHFKKPELHMFILLCILTLGLHYSLIISMKYYELAIGVDRIFAGAAYNLSALLCVLTALCMAIYLRKEILWVALLSFMIGIHIYNVVLLSATRSSALCLFILLATASVSLSYEIRNSVLSTKRSVYLGLISLSVMTICLLIILASLGYVFTDYSLISYRLMDEYSVIKRWKEVAEELENMDKLRWVLGGGLGYFAQAPYSSGRGTSCSPHLGIFAFLFKGGLVCFVPIVLLLYVRFPWHFVTALFRPHSLKPNARSAVLVVLPGIFAWTTLLSISGGYGPYNFLGVGFAIGAFFHIKEHGMSRFFQ